MKDAVYGVSKLTELQAVATELKDRIQAGEVIYLLGDLGAGKTTFTQMLLQACGVAEHVKSPTYTLYETYQGSDKQFVHMDLYRLTDPEELYFLGIEDLVNDNNVILIEWPKKGAGVLPEPDWVIELALSQLNRTLTITSKH